MNPYEEFVRRIVARAGFMTAAARRDLERELAAHLEDAIEEARGRGVDESHIFQEVCERFGAPDQIALELRMAHHIVHRAVLLGRSLTFMGLSFLTVAATILTLQLALAIVSDTPPGRAFAHVPEELVGFGSLALGYMGVLSAAPLFQRWRVVKALLMNTLVFSLLYVLTMVGLHQTSLSPILVFASGAAVCTLQHTALRRLWYLGTAIPIIAAVSLGAGPLLSAANEPGLWMTALIRWTGLTLACYVLTLLARNRGAGYPDPV